MNGYGVTEWTESMRHGAADCRRARPLPDRSALTLVQEWQCRIVGGALMAWLHDHGPRFLQERAAMADGEQPELLEEAMTSWVS